MTDKEKLAAEALRIKDNEAAMAGLAAMRKDAVEGLVLANANDADAIRELQAAVRVIDDFFGRLDAMIRHGKPKSPAGIV